MEAGRRPSVVIGNDCQTSDWVSIARLISPVWFHFQKQERDFYRVCWRCGSGVAVTMSDVEEPESPSGATSASTDRARSQIDPNATDDPTAALASGTFAYLFSINTFIKRTHNTIRWGR